MCRSLPYGDFHYPTTVVSLLRHPSNEIWNEMRSLKTWICFYFSLHSVCLPLENSNESVSEELENLLIRILNGISFLVMDLLCWSEMMNPNSVFLNVVIPNQNLIASVAISSFVPCSVHLVQFQKMSWNYWKNVDLAFQGWDAVDSLNFSSLFQQDFLNASQEGSLTVSGLDCPTAS